MQYLKHQNECPRNPMVNKIQEVLAKSGSALLTFPLPQAPVWLDTALLPILSWCENLDTLFLMNFVLCSLCYLKNTAFRYSYPGSGVFRRPLKCCSPSPPILALQTNLTSHRTHVKMGHDLGVTRKPVGLTGSKC